MAPTTVSVPAPVRAAKPWYKVLYIQVLIAIVLGALVGAYFQDFATSDGIKALVYFEVVSTFALVIGLLVGNLVRPGAGFGGAMASADKVATYAKQAGEQKSVDFFLHIIPDTVVGAFASGEILQVLLFSILFGFSLMAL